MSRSKKIERILEAWGEAAEGVLLADGFDRAFVGLGTQFNTVIAIYDYDRCIAEMQRSGISDRAEAEEHFEFNVAGSYVGKQTPIFLRRE